MNVLKRIFDCLSTVIIVLLIVLVVLLQGTKLFGIKPFAVLSGSMEPNYHTGSVVYVKTVSPEQVKVGDPITFNLSSSTVVTHRVVEIKSEERQFVTKGDANNTVDSPVGFDSLIGKVVFSIPFLGFIAVFFSATSGKIIMVLLFVVAISMIFISELLKKKTK